MLFGLLSFFYIFCAVLMILLILVQKGKGGMGLGYMGGGQQQLFGGSGGVDFFQRLTWILAATLIFGSLGLSLYRSQQARYGSVRTAPTEQAAPPSQA